MNTYYIKITEKDLIHDGKYSIVWSSICNTLNFSPDMSCGLLQLSSRSIRIYKLGVFCWTIIYSKSLLNKIRSSNSHQFKEGERFQIKVTEEKL